MKKFLILLCGLLAISARLPAQNGNNGGGATGNLTAASANCLTTNSCLVLNVDNSSGSATFKAAGTMNVVINFEASADELSVTPQAASWVAFSVAASDGSGSVTSATESGSNLSLVWQANVSAYKRVRMRVSTYTSGTVAAGINLSPASARSGGGGSGSGTIGGSIATNQVAFGGATANTIAGSPDLSYSNPGGSCTLTAVAALTECDSGASTAFAGMPAQQETIDLSDTTFNQVWTSSTGLGNSGSSRGTFLGMQEQGTGVSNIASLNYYLNGTLESFITWGGSGSRPSGISQGLQFNENGTVENGVNNSDGTITEFAAIPNGDFQIFTDVGKGLCIQGTTSGQGCLSVDATSTTMTSTLPLVAPNLMYLVLGSTQTLQCTGNTNCLVVKQSSSGGTPFSVQNSGGAALLSVTPGGTFQDQLNSTSVLSLGNGNNSHTFWVDLAPTVATGGCGGSGASITTNNGTGAFKVNVGTSNTGTCTITMPAASTDWICSATDITTTSTAVSQTKSKPGGTPTTQITLQNYTDISGTGAWTDSDVIAVACTGE